MATVDLAAVVRQMYEAFNAHDLERVAACAQSDARALNVPFGARLSFREDAQGWLTAFPDGRCEITNLIAQGECVIAEFTGRGTHTGPLKGPSGEIAATGRRVELQCVDVFRCRGGKITESKLYFDSGTLLTQLGLGMGAAATQGRAATTQPPRH
jgi:predicted ester cyclase